MTDTPMSPERAAFEKWLAFGKWDDKQPVDTPSAYAWAAWRASRDRALEETAKICEGLVDECSKARESRTNCHNLDAQKIRELKESQ